MLLLPWLAVVLLLFRSPPGSASAVSVPAAESGDNPITAHPGPWGELQYSRLLIEPPDEFVGSAVDDTSPPRWLFPGYTAEMLSQLWLSARLSAAQISDLESRSTPLSGAGGVQILPPPALVRSLGPDARATIYTALSVFAENDAQHEPFRFRADSADEWLDNSTLRPDLIAAVKQLLYRRGNSILFSDQAVLLPTISSRDDRIMLIKTLARKATLLVKLRLRPGSDIDTIADYWDRGPRRKSLRALLESISHRPQGTTIDIVHLLPKFARAHLFTYPNSATPEESRNRDCHWTSLNFFSDVPDDRFMNVDVVKQTLETDYVPASGRLLLGDVLALVNPRGEVIHSCVFVADDIVFTKNGGSEGAPWILMNLPDVIAFYPADPALTVRAYRRKDL